MSDAIVEENPETAPAQLPAETVTPSIGVTDDRSLDDLLAEYEAATSKSAEAEPTADTLGAENTGQPAVTDDELTKFLNGLDSERNRISELEGEIGSLRAAEVERQARVDFEGWAKQLQSKLGPHVDESFARTNLMALAMERPELQIAWQHRHITDAEIRAADAEFKRLELLYNQVQNAPDDPRKQSAIQQIEQRGWQLGYMLNARTMLDRAWKDVVKRASKVAPPIDELATADRDAVAFAVRESTAGRPICLTVIRPVEGPLALSLWGGGS